MRRTIWPKGFNLLQERLRSKGIQIYISLLNPTDLPRCLDNKFQDFFQLFQFFEMNLLPLTTIGSIPGVIKDHSSRNPDFAHFLMDETIHLPKLKKKRNKG